MNFLKKTGIKKFFNIVLILLILISQIQYLTYAVEITSINISPAFDISHFGGYTISAELSGDVTSGSIDIAGINGDGGTCRNYYASGDCYINTGLNFPLVLSGGTGTTRVKTGVRPDHIYPQIFFAPNDTVWNNAPLDNAMNRSSYEILHFNNPFSMESGMNFFIELNILPRSVANSVNLNVYLVKKDKTISFFQSNRLTNTGAELIGSFSRTTTYNHSHGDNSQHYLITLTTNTDGTIGTNHLNISSDFRIILSSNTTTPSKGRYMRYQPSSLCNNTNGWYLGNLGTRSTTLQSGCPDTHIHIARRDVPIQDAVTAAITASDLTGSITGAQSFYFGILPNLAPNTTVFNTPIAGTYTGNIDITRDPASDVNGDSLTYSIDLLDYTGNVLTRLITGTSNTGYTRDSTSTGDGEYSLQGEVCDASLCKTFTLGDNFFVNNVADPDTTPPSINITSGQYFSGNVTIEISDEHYSGTVVTYSGSDNTYTTTGFTLTGAGYYVLTAYDISGYNTSVAFTIDTIVPTFTGVISGGNYYTGIIITYTDNNTGTTATLSGISYTGLLITATGTYTFIVTDIAGNSTGATFTIHDADTTGPTGYVDYTISTPTSGNVIATLTGLSETVTITNNSGSIYYLFTGNGTFTFEFEDGAGNTGNAIANVTRIDKTIPTITLNGTSTIYIERYTPYIESGAVWSDNGATGDVNIFSGIVDTGNIGTYIREYFYFDGVQTGTNTRTIHVVDTTKPTATIIYTPISGSRTSGNVIATLSGSETLSGENATGYTFTNNGSFLFTFQDLAGNTGEITATVNRIDIVAPTITSTGTITTTTGTANISNITITESGVGLATALFAYSGVANSSVSGNIQLSTGNYNNLTGFIGGLDHNATYFYSITLTDILGNRSIITGTFATILDWNIVYTEVRSGNVLSGINNNLSSVTNDNVTNFIGLYLEIPSVGKIEIQSGINLTDSGTQAFLQSLRQNMIMQNGFINFIVYTGSTISGEAFKNIPAILTMYLTTAQYTNGTGTADNIVVRDNYGNIITSSDIISNFECTGSSLTGIQQECSFDTLHFTSFGTKPTLPFVHITSSNSNSGFAKIGDTITVSFTGSEELTGVSLNIAGNSIIVSGTGTARSGTYTIVGAETQGTTTISINFEDLFGNSGNIVNTTTDSSQVIIDNIKPTITNVATGQYFSGSITPAITEINYSGAILNAATYISGTAITGDGIYNLVITDLAGNSTGVTFTIDTTQPTFAGVNSGRYYTGAITLTFTDSGTLNGVSISSGYTTGLDGIYIFSITDSANNTTGAIFTIDNTNPTITNITSGQYFSGSITPAITETNYSGATLNGSEYISGTAITGDGIYNLVITDLAGNSTGITFTIDATQPAFSGAHSGAYYNTNQSITFSDTNLSGATLNGAAYTSGDVISSEGVYIFIVRDTAGNSTGVTFTIDKTQPTFRGITSGVYYSGNQFIGFSDTNLSGATVNGTTYNSGDTISTDGIKTFIVTDLAGNTTGAIFTIDKTLPSIGTGTISLGNTGVNGATGYYNGTITIRTTISDTNISGATCEYTTGISRASATYSGGGYCDSVITPNNHISIGFRIQDLAGNINTGGTTTYIYDITPPTTTDNANSITGRTDVTVTLSPIDTGVGLSGTRYCVDTTNSCTPTLSGTSVSVTGTAGVITHKYVRYYSVDTLNNTETTKTSAYIHIDKETPILTGTTTFSSNNASNSGYATLDDTITITFTSHEPLSSLPTLTYSGGSSSTGIVTSLGSNNYSATYSMKSTDTQGYIRFNVTMIDSVGNTGIINITGAIIYDSIAPAAISITHPTTFTYFQGGTTKTITRTTGSEINFGSTGITLQYSNDGWNTLHSVISTGTNNDGSYDRTFPIVDSTLASVRIIATDLAGNRANFTGNLFTLDSTSPTTVSFTYPVGVIYLKGGSGYTITRTGGTDNFLSGKVIEYLSGGVRTHIYTYNTDSFTHLWTPPTAGVSANTSGARLRITVYDRAGLNTTAEFGNFIIDSTAPTAFTFTGNSNRRNTGITATGTSTDTLARIRSTGIVYRTTTAFTGICNETSTTPPTFSSEGYRTGYACVMDNAGNIRTGQQLYRIDMTAPLISMGSDIATNTGIATNITVTGDIAGISGYTWTKLSGPTGGIITFSSSTGQNPTVTGSGDGIYVLQVVVRDNANNITTGTINFTRSTTAPMITTGAITNTTSQTPTFSFTATNSGTLSRSGSCSSATTTAVSGSNSIALSALGNATYSGCYVRIRDILGNTGLRYNLPTFTVNYTAPSGGGGGGGGGGGLPTCLDTQLMCSSSIYVQKAGVYCQGGNLNKPCGTDLCVDGDYSGNPSDGLCKDPTKVEASTGTTTTSTGKRINYVSPYNKELTDAYSYAYHAKITTVNNIQYADLNGILIRSHLAKMMSEYAMKVLGKTPDTNRICIFSDMKNQTEEFKKYAILACQLGLMGLKTDGTPATIFNPDGQVTRAIFGTTLSRTIRGETYNGGSVRYDKHLKALQQNEVMVKIDKPFNRELRGYVMLMMMRADQKITKSSYLTFTSLRGSKVFVANTSNTTTTTSSQFTTEELDFIKNINKSYQFTEGYTLGQSNAGVRYLQYFLKAKTYYTGTINGINNAATVSALFQFQSDNKIVGSETDQGAGYLGPTTREIINPLLKKLLNP